MTIFVFYNKYRRLRLADLKKKTEIYSTTWDTL